MKYETLDAFVEDLPRLAEKAQDKLAGNNGLFALTTNQGRRMLAQLDDGVITLPESADHTPDCEIFADEKDLLAMINGNLNPAMALLFGKVKVNGDMNLLMKLASLA